MYKILHTFNRIAEPLGYRLYYLEKLVIAVKTPEINVIYEVLETDNMFIDITMNYISQLVDVETITVKVVNYWAFDKKPNYRDIPTKYKTMGDANFLGIADENL